MLVNAAREGLGYEIASEVVDMEPFYFEGINVEPAEEEEQEEDDQTPAKINHAPKAAIELMVVGGSRVRLSGEKSTDEDDDDITYSWGVPAAIDVADKTTATIEFDVPEVTADTEFTFTLFVRDTWGEPSTQQRFVLSVVAAASQNDEGKDEEESEEQKDDEPADEQDNTDDQPQPADDDVVPSDETTPYPLWDTNTVYGGNWGTFETVSWKGHNYQVKWWSQGNQPDLNCGQFAVWTDLGAY